jgi:polysaccharide biosynthesis transport protein
MTIDEQDRGRPSFDGGEIMFLLLKHRWKLILCTLAGVASAAFVYITHNPPFQSDAKLLVRHVLERSPINAMESPVGTGSRNSEAVINSEKEILQSWDLAFEVAQKIGPERLVGAPETPAALAEAATVVHDGVFVESSKGSNVISVYFRHHDPELAVTVLNQLLDRYFEKHLAVHRSLGAFEFVAEQKRQVSQRLAETEAQLTALKSEAKVISLGETTNLVNETLARTQRDLEFAEVELAEQQARVASLENLTGTASTTQQPGPQPSAGEVQQYQALVSRLRALRNEGLDLLSRYTPESDLVRMNRDQIEQLERERSELEQRFPSLSTTNAPTNAPGQTRADLLSERARLAAIKARTETLRQQLESVRARAQELSEIGPRITQLERRKEVEEQNFKYFEATLERARIDETLDPSKIPNISILQRPSPAEPVDETIHVQLALLAGGGATLGLGLVFLFGFVFDRSIKRPADVQRKLGCNHLLAIPYADRADLKAFTIEARAMLPDGVSAKNRVALTKAQLERFVQPYCEAIADRLVHHLALAGKTHKPKLVAVSSCHTGAGTSTIAAGLATTLSRTGEGKVLLVDVNGHVNGKAGNHRYFFGGDSASSLGEMLEPGGASDPVAQNLYLATVSPRESSDASRPLPARFHHLLPRLRHSEFDYIVFDMPPAVDTSPTLATASFMDKVFLVLEAEKTPRAAARRALEELSAMRADTSILVNKTRQYGPAWLRLEG